MSTSSAIGVMHGSKAKVVYCHHDGYLDGVGRTLLTYDSPSANELISLGDMSSLGYNINQTEFYGRDRDETGIEFRVIFSDTELYDIYEGCEYFYIMQDGVWMVSRGPDTEWRILADALRQKDEPGFKAPSVTRLIFQPEE